VDDGRALQANIDVESGGLLDEPCIVAGVPAG
jgi:hypothetical protein